MNIDELYEIQKEFDARLIKKKGLEGKDLLPDTVLALQVEIGELANEWRGFKYWSNDQWPRNNVLVIGDNCGEEKITNPMLEEYADCLHLLLSIANLLGLSGDDLFVSEDELEGETVVIFTSLLHEVGMLIGDRFLLKAPKNIKREQMRGILYTFYNLGEGRLGFTFEQVEKAFLDKNEINHSRLSNGY
ncbi:MAG: dUTP diphosphatase [Paenibacillaceae bacterium]